MRRENGVERAVAARADGARVITLLERATVSALGQSTDELAVAITRVEQLQGEFAGEPGPSPGKVVIAEIMVALRKDLWRAGRLLRHALELRTGRGAELEDTKKGEWVRRPGSA